MNLEKPVQVMCERLQGLGGLASGDSRVSLVTEGKIALSVLDAMYKDTFVVATIRYMLLPGRNTRNLKTGI